MPQIRFAGKCPIFQNFIGAVCYYAFTHEKYFQIYTEFWPVGYANYVLVLNFGRV